MNKRNVYGCAVAMVFSLLLSPVFMLVSPSVQAAADLRAIGKYEELGSPQFFAGIYTAAPYTSADDLIYSKQGKVIEIRVLANRIFSRRFKRMWLEGSAINSEENDYHKHTENMVRFSKMMDVNLEKNDILRLERSQSEGVEIKLNGESLGFIVEPEFFDLLVRVLVGPVPISVSLKEAIVAAKPEQQMLTEFNKINIGINAKRIRKNNVPVKNVAALVIDAPKVKLPKVKKKAVKVAPKPRPVAIAAKAKPQPVVTKKWERREPPISEADKNLNKSSPRIADKRKRKNPSQDTVAVVASLGSGNIINQSSVTEQEKREIEAVHKRVAGDRKSELIARQKYYSKVLLKINRGMKKIKAKAPMGGARIPQKMVPVNVVIKIDGNVKVIDARAKAANKTQIKAAIRAVELAAPFAKFPSEILDDELEMTIPVSIDWIYSGELKNSGLL